MTRSKVWRWLKWSLLSVFLLMLTVVGSLSAIVATEAGSRWFILQVADYLPLELGEIRGNLLTGLDLSYFDYRVEQDGAVQGRYRAENVSFRWQPLALFYSAVSVQSLSADGIQVLLPPTSSNEPEPVFWPSLALPVRIELGQTQLTNIVIERNQGELSPHQLARLQRVSTTFLSLGTFNLRLEDLALVTDDYNVIAGGRVALRYPYNANLDVQWQYEVPPPEGQTEPLLLKGRGEVQGDIEQLTITHQLAAPFAIQSRLTLTPNFTRPPAAVAQATTPQLEAHSEWAAQALLARWFPDEATIPVVGGELQLAGWLDDYQADLKADLTYGDLPPMLVSAKTHGNLEQLAIAELNLALADVQAGKTSSAQIPGAKAQVQGLVSWAPQLNWDLSLTAKGIDPLAYFPDWPGRLDLAVKTSGEYNAQGLRVAVEQLELEGRLRAFEIRAGGDLSFDGERWQSQQLELVMGANQLRVHGSLTGAGEQLDLHWQVNAPLLNQLDNQLQGSLSTQGKVQGSLARPLVQLEARADKLQWREDQLGQLLLTLAPAEGGDYAFTLAAEDVRLAQQDIRDLALAGTGSLAQHQLQGHIDSAQLGKLELALDSGYRDHRWQGRWTRFDLRFSGLPRWWLLRSEPMHATAESVDLGELCLTTRMAWGRRSGAENGESNGEPDGANTGATESPGIAASPSPGLEPSLVGQPTAAERETPGFCTQGRWNPTAGLDIKAQWIAVPLRQLRALLKPEVNLAGVIEGDFALQMPPGKTPQATLALQTRNGELHYQYADNPLEVFPWQSAEIKALWQDQLLNASFTTDWAQFGSANAEVVLNTSNQQLSGQAKINFGDLAPLGAFLPFADDMSGQLAADLELSGSAQQPIVQGHLTLAQGHANVPRLGLELSDVQLALSSFGDGRMELRSSFRSGEGTLEVAGDLSNFGNVDWQLSGSVKGDNFLVIDQPQLNARVSPTIELKANQQEIRLTGDALIPSARADIKSLPETATRVSDDVIIEENGKPNGRNGQLAFYMNVNAELGKEVSFNGFGLNSRLSGKMKLIKTPARPLLATGYVDVVDGKYKAYGQELSIERGRLIFQGPYENPGLDIRAQRTLRGKTGHIVGLAIGGTLQRPTSSVYSDPPLQNEGEAMALLLTGKPLSEASAGDAYAIISAMSGLGMDQGGSITGQIADTFRLDEFRINSDEGLEHSSLWVGKYLTERLFIRYIVSLFDQAANKVGVSYQMSDRLRLEAESGAVQSVDMIYKIER